MKKILTSAFSLLTSLAVISGSSVLEVAAEAAVVHGVLDMSSEEVTCGEIDGIVLDMPEMPEALGNFKAGAYNYGYDLDGNNAEVYKAFMQLINPSLDPITVDLPEPLTFTSSSRSFSETEKEDFYNLVFSNCKPGMDCATFDMPEIFWLDDGMISVSVGSMPYSYNWFTGKYTYTIDKLIITPAALEAFGSVEDIWDYKERLMKEIEDFPVKGNTRYEQLKSIQDAIALRTYYDTDAKFRSSAVGTLVEPGVVCEGYSKAFKLICDRIGIPCVCVFGNWDKETSMAHMWNYVLMDDDKWYAMDVTWDDYDGDYGLEVVYTHFLKGSDSFYSNHTPSADYNITVFNYPPLQKKNYDIANAKPIVTEPVVTEPETTTTSSMTTSTTTTLTTTTTTEKTTTTIRTTSTTTTRKTTTSTTTKTTTTKPTTTTTEAATTKRPPRTTTTTTRRTTTTTTRRTTTTTTTVPVTTVTTTTAPPEPLYGDLNGDGIISIADLIYCTNAVHGAVERSWICDLNGDGHLGAFDVLLMKKILIASGNY